VVNAWQLSFSNVNIAVVRMFKSRERASFDISCEFEKIREKLLLNKSFFFEVFFVGGDEGSF
jgi:hypothetical protein